MKNISYIDTRSRIRYNCTVSSPAARHRLFLGLFIGKHLPSLPSSPHTHNQEILVPISVPGVLRTRRLLWCAVILIFARHVQREGDAFIWLYVSYRCISMYLSVRLSAAASVSVTVYTCNYNALLKATTIAQACKQADTQTHRQTYREGQTKIQWDRQTDIQRKLTQHIHNLHVKLISFNLNAI